MSTRATHWPIKSQELAIELHKALVLDSSNWHKLKGSSERRAAELLAGALVQLVQDGKPSDIEELTKQAIQWIKKEIKDPGCPNH